jgi:CheY-like chemotaxis protein
MSFDRTAGGLDLRNRCMICLNRTAISLSHWGKKAKHFLSNAGKKWLPAKNSGGNKPFAFAGETFIVSPSEMPAANQPQYQILVVDDEPTVCKAISMMLKYDGHRVQTAESGAVALELFEQTPFDIVFTDYLMPEMKGDKLITLLRARRSGQRIIMATAFAEDFLVNGKPSAGVDWVLRKPFSLDELRAAVAGVMG